MHDASKLIQRLTETRDRLSDDGKQRLDGQIRAAHDYLLAVRAGTLDPKAPPPPRELLLAHSLLHDDPDGLLKDALSPDVRLTHVLPDGGVLFGGVDYDLTDPKWTYTIFAWEETKGQEPPFKNNPAVIEIPNQATLAILGDWGGNNGPAQQVAKTAAVLKPDYWVHIGDVYYAGTNQGGRIEEDYEREHFLDVWPGVPGRSYALNSNHDMYAHATGYFNTALASSMFGAQKGCSYFALYNDAFRIVGLDTAYYDPDQSGIGFMTGSLGPSGPGTQSAFLHEQAEAAAAHKQTLILISHHNGLTIEGKKPTPLWHEVAEQLAPLAGQHVVWYWGHIHIGAAYVPQTASGVGISARCCGHGCIPWGIASDLRGPNVTWFEKEVLGPGSNYFVTNGFATLKLDGGALTEVFYGQRGTLPHWTSTTR